jgi:hypothetical protein
MNESKRTIERIEFIEEQKQEIKRIWEGKPPAKLIERWKKEGLRSNQEKYYTPPSM